MSLEYWYRKADEHCARIKIERQNNTEQQLYERLKAKYG